MPSLRSLVIRASSFLWCFGRLLGCRGFSAFRGWRCFGCWLWLRRLGRGYVRRRRLWAAGLDPLERRLLLGHARAVLPVLLDQHGAVLARLGADRHPVGDAFALQDGAGV